MDEIIQLVGVVGVPAALCFFILHRVDTSIKELTAQIHDLNNFLRISYIKRTPVDISRV